MSHCGALALPLRLVAPRDPVLMADSGIWWLDWATSPRERTGPSRHRANPISRDRASRVRLAILPMPDFEGKLLQQRHLRLGGGVWLRRLEAQLTVAINPPTRS